MTTSRFLPAAASPVVAPNGPSNLTAAVSGSTVTLNWTAPVGGDAPTSYQVQAGSSTGQTNIASFDTGSTATALAVFSVPSGTYFIRVLAVNSAGASAASNEVQVIVGGAPPPCTPLSPPNGLVASINGSTVTLSWTPPAGCAPTSYVIQAGSTPGASNLANFSTGSTATTFTATGVGAGTYYVRILSAEPGVLSAASTEIAFTVGTCSTVPNAPANLRASASGSTITLAWDPPAGGCAPSSYLLQAGSTPGASDIANAMVAGTSLTAANVANGTYYIRIKAVNAVGQSSPSNEIAVTVGPVAPTTMVAGFQLFDPATQADATTECRFRAPNATTSTTCTLRSTSFTTGTNTIVSYHWVVQYTYGTVKIIDQTVTTPSLSFTDICASPAGTNGGTDDGEAQPLDVTLTVTDNLGATATAKDGVNSPQLFVRLYNCGK